MFRISCAIGALCLLAQASWAVAAEQPTDISAYPELSYNSMLPPLIAELKRTVPDPYSIRDFVICPPEKIKMEGGRPVRWASMISFNSKTSSGGYGGITIYGAIFRAGQPPHIANVKMGGNGGLDGVINNAMAKKMVDCPTIPDDRIQKLVTPGATPPSN